MSVKTLSLLLLTSIVVVMLVLKTAPNAKQEHAPAYTPPASYCVENEKLSIGGSVPLMAPCKNLKIYRNV